VKAGLENMPVQEILHPECTHLIVVCRIMEVTTLHLEQKKRTANLEGEDIPNSHPTWHFPEVEVKGEYPR
jgi:hypothetical protein